MNRTLRVAAFVAAVAILVLLVRQVGLSNLVAGMRSVGWLMIPIVLLHGVVYALNAVAWWLTLAHEPGSPRFLAIYRISLTGFAINFLTPVVNAGGEPYRIAALTPALGRHKAAGAVLQYAMLHAISSLLMWLTAIAVALTLPAMSVAMRVAFAGAGTILVAALTIVLSGHRHGFVTGLAGWVSRRRLGRMSRWLSRRETDFSAVDAHITGLRRDRPHRLAAAVAVDYISRLVAVGELLLIAHAIGVAMSVTVGAMISGLSALAVNVLFLLPWELGSREGSLFMLFGMAGVPASVGVVAALVTRTREFAWAAIGLAAAGFGATPAIRERVGGR